MAGNVLVDSSVFIGLIREQRDPLRELTSRIDLTDLATCGMVRLEVLRGVRSKRALEILSEFFDVMINIPTDNRLWESAAAFGNRLDRTIGGSIPGADIVIATCALQGDAAVLTYDRHFSKLPGLTVLSSLEELD